MLTRPEGNAGRSRGSEPGWRPPPRPAPREAPTPRAGLRGDDRPAKVSGASARPPGPLPSRPRGRAGGSWARARLTHMLLKRNRSSHVKARRVVIAPPPRRHRRSLLSATQRTPHRKLSGARQSRGGAGWETASGPRLA